MVAFLLGQQNFSLCAITESKHSVVSPKGRLSRHCHGSRGKPLKNGEQRVKYGREVGSRASSQLLDSPRNTPAPANRD